jgi:hypothetical protein
VFVPIEAPDRIAAAARDDHPAWRRRVDARLRALLVEGALGADVEVLEVQGSVARRAQAVLARVRPTRHRRGDTGTSCRWRRFRCTNGP